MVCWVVEKGIDFLVDLKPNIKIGFVDALRSQAFKECRKSEEGWHSLADSAEAK
jgi:hypothetical protein